jgi:signal transduction histidine kinase
MDWIDEQLMKWNEKLKMKSLKVTLRIYIMIAIVLVIILYILTLLICDSWSTIADQRLTLFLEEIQTYSIVLYSLLAIIFITNSFYKNKIEEPISILKKEALYISRNNLSVSCSYKSGDELGEVCEAFDQMRIQMIHNYENIWSQMESQRQLNAIFAHDIRTPLTVMQGYIDMLVRFYPVGKISEEKLFYTLEMIQEQLKKLKEYTEKMKNLIDVESLEIKPRMNDYSALIKKIKENIEGLAFYQNQKIILQNKINIGKEKISEGYYDEEIILEVVNNLLSNACSFAENLIEIIIEVDKDFLRIYIRDDGKGFLEKEFYKALDPYYSSRNQIGEHFGMGLTICKMLCEKHGGKISLKNSLHKGAIVCASFRI